MKKCALNSEKICDNCGDCNFCDLDPFKPCDNCCRCLGEADYTGMEITKIVLPKEIQLKHKQNKTKKN